MVVLNYSIGYNEHLLDGKVFFNRANLRSLIRQRSKNKNKIGDNENLFRSRMIHLNMAFENQHSSERFKEKQSNTQYWGSGCGNLKDREVLKNIWHELPNTTRSNNLRN